MRPALLLLTCLIPALPAQGGLTADQALPQPILLRGGKVLPMDGPAIDAGEVLVRGRHIVAVGRELEAPAHTHVMDFPDAWIVPGFVELHCHVGSDGGYNDTVLPHNMDLRTLDILIQDSPELRRAAEAGVTTALCIPGSGSSIGGIGTLVKTVGDSFEERLVRFPGAMKIALHARGGNPVRRAGDLGATRLGLHYMLKVVLREAKDYHEAWVEYEAGRGGKPDFNPRLDPLRGLFDKQWPVILHAYGTNDTMTAVRILLWGLDVPIVISHGVYDSFLVKKELAATGVPMNIGPRQYEFYEGRFVGNAAELYGAGVPISICTDAPVVPQEELQVQAAMAVRLGLPAEAALRGLTIEPAKAIGVADRLGSLTPGKDADVCVFPGDPLDPRNAPLLVMIEGKLVHERE